MGIAHFPARHDVHDHRMLNVIIYVLSTYVITVVIHIAVGKFLIEVSFLDASVSQLGSDISDSVSYTTMLHGATPTAVFVSYLCALLTTADTALCPTRATAPPPTRSAEKVHRVRESQSAW